MFRCLFITVLLKNYSSDREDGRIITSKYVYYYRAHQILFSRSKISDFGAKIGAIAENRRKNRSCTDFRSDRRKPKNSEPALASSIFCDLGGN